MPMYDWKCHKCKLNFAIIREVKEYERVPGVEDISEKWPEEREEFLKCEHEWERLIGGTQKHIYGMGWGPGRKGSW